LIFYSCSKEDTDSQKFYANSESSFRIFPTKILEQLFFVGKYGGRAGVYKYDFGTKSYKIFWGTSEETVIKLSYSYDLETIFFLTARSIGIRKGVSSIKDIKLYRINPDELSTALIGEIGDAVQLYSEWSGTNYKIQFTRFDLKYASYIDKIYQIYSRFGKMLKEENESYNFIKDSYPGFNIQQKTLLSPSGNFGIKNIQDSVYLYAAGSTKKIFIDSSANKISGAGWSEEESFVFLTINKEPEQNDLSALYIFDIVNRRIKEKFLSTEKINFYVSGDVLIFDKTIEYQSTIEIFDFRKNETIQTIKLWGGCGLQYISDY